MQTFSIGTVAFTYIGNALDGRFPSSAASVHLALIIHKLELRNRERMVKPYDVKSFYFRSLAILYYTMRKPQQERQVRKMKYHLFVAHAEELGQTVH